MEQDNSFYGTEKIGRIIFRIAPPVMLAQLIQALYNIVDSFFVGKYSDSSLTALSIIYPIQLLTIALGVGTGVGINTCIAYFLGIKKWDEADEAAGMGTPLGFVLWLACAALCYFLLPAYASMATGSKLVIKEVVTYGRIVCICSMGLFFESIWSKILQAHGDMKTPMLAQIIGAGINIVLDPVLIFGMFGVKEFGIAGAAMATVAGQVTAALVVMQKAFRMPPDKGKYIEIVKRIYSLGIPNILMQSAYTFYILGLNLILASFSDQAVTVLGLYYKWQAFFYIPLGALQTCIVPVISYNYAADQLDRCKRTLRTALVWGVAFMSVGTLCFEFIPSQMLSLFTRNDRVIEIGCTAFRMIGISFVPMVTSLTFPVFFQAIGYAVRSSVLTIIRSIVLFVPLGFLFSRFGLGYFWVAFPVTEMITSLAGILLYRQFLNAGIPHEMGRLVKHKSL